MHSASGRLAYQLYADPAHTEIWGNGASGRMVSFAAAVPPGTYQDQVVITLSY